MITVKNVLEKGIEFVADDIVAGVTGLFPETAVDYAILAPNPVSTSTSLGFMHPECIVKEFAPRENIGVQPVADDLLVDVTFFDGLEPTIETHKACDVDWSEDLNMIWKPSLKNWEEAEEIKVRLTCSDELVNPDGLIEYEFSELPKIGERCVYFVANKRSEKEKLKHHLKEMTCVAHVGMHDGLAVLVSDDYAFSTVCNSAWIRKLETPEQKEAREIEEAAKYLCENSPHPCEWANVGPLFKEEYIWITKETGYRVK